MSCTSTLDCSKAKHFDLNFNGNVVSSHTFSSRIMKYRTRLHLLSLERCEADPFPLNSRLYQCQRLLERWAYGEKGYQIPGFRMDVKKKWCWVLGAGCWVVCRTPSNFLRCTRSTPVQGVLRNSYNVVNREDSLETIRPIRPCPDPACLSLKYR